MKLPLLGALSELDVSVLIVLAVFTTFIFGLYVFWRGYPRPLKDIPYNPESAKRWLGDVPSFKTHYNATGEGWDWFSLQCERLNSPIVQVFLGPWQKPSIVLVDQLEIRDITTKRANEFDRGGFLTRWLSSAVPNGTIAMPTHSTFKAQRAVWQGTMLNDTINKMYAPHMTRHAAELVTRWKVKAELSEGKPFEANLDVRAALFSIVWAAAFGTDLGLLRKQSPEFLKEHVQILPDEAKFPVQKDEGVLAAISYLLDTLETTRSTPFPVLHHWFLEQTPAYRRANKLKKSIIGELLHNSRAKFESSKGEDQKITCAMDYVYNQQAKRLSKGALVADEEMEDELIVFLVGGFESSQHNTSWGVKYLAQSPSAQASLYAELIEAFPGSNADNLPTAQEIVSKELPYLDAVLEEVLRLARTNAGALRITTMDTQIYGMRIPAGTDVFGVHTGESAVIELPPRPAGWKSGPRVGQKKGPWERGTLKQFKPERWLTDDGQFDQSAGPNMAFGVGVRGCFGQRLARTSLRLVFVSMVLAFELQPLSGEFASFRAEEKLVRMAQKCYVALKVRE